MRSLRYPHRRTHEYGGFTLVELLIVIVVLGVLAAVVVFALGGVSASASVASCKADARIVEDAVRAYMTENAGTPPTTADLTASTDPYLSSFPTSSSFAIVLDGGTVEVSAPLGAAPVPATDPDACAGAGAATASTDGSTTTSTTTTSTTSTTTTTTTLAPQSGVTVVATPTTAGAYSEDVLQVTNTYSITSLTATISVTNNDGESGESAHASYSTTDVKETSDTKTNPMTFTWTAKKALGTGGGELYVKFKPTTHDPSGDTYTVTVTSNGVSQTFSGSF